MIKRKPLLLLFFLLKELSALNIGNKIIDVVKQRMLPSLVSSNEALGRRDFVKDIFVVTTSLSVLFRPEEAHATRAVGRFFFIKIVFPSITGRCDSISDLTPACFCWYRFRFIFHIV